MSMWLYSRLSASDLQLKLKELGVVEHLLKHPQEVSYSTIIAWPV